MKEYEFDNFINFDKNIKLNEEIKNLLKDLDLLSDWFSEKNYQHIFITDTKEGFSCISSITLCNLESFFSFFIALIEKTLLRNKCNCLNCQKARIFFNLILKKFKNLKGE